MSPVRFEMDSRCPMNAPPAIGICGRIGSGKSYIAKLLIDQGYRHVNADAVFKQEVLTNPDYRKDLSSFLSRIGICAFISSVSGEHVFGSELSHADDSVIYNVRGLMDALFSPTQAGNGFPLLTALNEFNHPWMYSALFRAMSEPSCYEVPVVLEMALLPMFANIHRLPGADCMPIIEVRGAESYGLRMEIIAARDPHRPRSYNTEILAYHEKVFRNSTYALYTLRNMEGSSFLPDESILQSIYSICQSSIALRAVGLSESKDTLH